MFARECPELQIYYKESSTALPPTPEAKFAKYFPTTDFHLERVSPASAKAKVYIRKQTERINQERLLKLHQKQLHI